MELKSSELLFAAAIGFLGWIAVKLSLKLPSLLKGKLGKRRTNYQYVDQWVDLVEKQTRRFALLSLTGKTNILLITFLAPAAFLLGLYLFDNPILAALTAAMVVLIVEQKAAHQARLQREAIDAQLAVVVRMFAAEYMKTPQVERALGVIGKRLSEPIGSIINRAYRRLLSNDDPDKVLSQLAVELNSVHGMVFVQMLRLARKGSEVSPMFSELASRITVSRELSMLYRAETSGERSLSLVITAAPLVLYFILSAIIPETNEFLSDTLAGRLVVFTAFASAVVFAVLDKLIGGDIS